jgi:hypothetical protein
MRMAEVSAGRCAADGPLPGRDRPMIHSRAIQKRKKAATMTGTTRNAV